MMFGNGFGGGGLREFGNCFGYGGGYMHGGFLMLAFLLFAVAAILGIWFLVKKAHVNKTDSIVMETLKMRLVSGEITEEEYISKKNVLK